MFIVISFLKTPKRPNVPRPKVPNRGIFNHFHSTLFSAFLDRKIPLKNGCFWDIFLTVSDIFRTFALSIRRRKITL